MGGRQKKFYDKRYCMHETSLVSDHSYVHQAMCAGK